MEEVVIIACMRPQDMTGPPYPGSTKEKCADCGTEIWSDPMLRAEVVRRHGEELKLVCYGCAEKFMDPQRFAQYLAASAALLRDSIVRQN